MFALFISLLYTVSIILLTFVMLMYIKPLKQYKFLLVTLMGIYSLWKWLLLKVPEIHTLSWITFWDSLLFWLIFFWFVVLPFFTIFDKYIDTWEVTNKEKKTVFWLFIAFLVLHTIPEAIQIWYQYTFWANWSIWEVVKAIIEELPEFIMLLAIYIMITGDRKSSLILWILTGVLFPIVTLLVWIFANTSNPSLEMTTKNILLWFYIIFWIMTFNLLLKYNKKYLILYVAWLVIFYAYRILIWF